MLPATPVPQAQMLCYRFMQKNRLTVILCPCNNLRYRGENLLFILIPVDVQT